MDTDPKRVEHEVEFQSDNLTLRGILNVPPAAKGVVAFAHGSGSGRFSPRNQFVAGVLQAAGLATLLLDLLEEGESRDRAKVFDIDLLAERLGMAAAWLKCEPTTKALPLGYFGASTGAGAALVAAASDREAVRAVVSRGGRPDLAGEHLKSVRAPTLLIVGGNDRVVIELNQRAFGLLPCPKDLIIIPGATHLFEERGALEEVARLARDWFIRYLTSVNNPSRERNQS
jgi:putative phosphoribosyl transferase